MHGERGRFDVFFAGNLRHQSCKRSYRHDRERVAVLVGNLQVELVSVARREFQLDRSQGGKGGELERQGAVGGLLRVGRPIERRIR